MLCTLLFPFLVAAFSQTSSNPFLQTKLLFTLEINYRLYTIQSSFLLSTLQKKRDNMHLGANAEIRSLVGNEVLSELEPLLKVNSIIGVRDIVVDLLVILGVIMLVELLDNGIISGFAIIYIGIRQRHLSNLGHELTHTKLVSRQKVNYWIGNGVMFLLGEPFYPYKLSHWRHHTRLGKRGDPMLESYIKGRATKPRSNRLSFLFFVYLRSVVSRLPFETIQRWWGRGERETEISRLTRVLTWVGVTMLAFYLGVFFELFIYWILPLILIRPAVTWLTDLGNHAGLIYNENPFHQTRGWHSNWLTRHFLGGHLDDMYHPVHHFFPGIPWRNLPRADAILRTQVQQWSSVPWCSGFFYRRRSTPNIPCVWEDIIQKTRLSAE